MAESAVYPPPPEALQPWPTLAIPRGSGRSCLRAVSALREPHARPAGKARPTGAVIVLCLLTFGSYAIVWFYQVHDEMRRHRGVGMSGRAAVLLTILAGVAMPFVTAAEVGALYADRGQPKPVSARTGLWYFPGIVILIGPIVWFVKTNGAINSYWHTLSARSDPVRVDGSGADE